MRRRWRPASAWRSRPAPRWSRTTSSSSAAVSWAAGGGSGQGRDDCGDDAGRPAGRGGARGVARGGRVSKVPRPAGDASTPPAGGNSGHHERIPDRNVSRDLHRRRRRRMADRQQHRRHGRGAAGRGASRGARGHRPDFGRDLAAVRRRRAPPLRPARGEGRAGSGDAVDRSSRGDARGDHPDPEVARLVGAAAGRAPAIFEQRSHHIKDSLAFLPRIARRLYHARDLGQPFDFITWFEFAPEHAGRSTSWSRCCAGARNGPTSTARSTSACRGDGQRTAPGWGAGT